MLGAYRIRLLCRAVTEVCQLFRQEASSRHRCRQSCFSGAKEQASPLTQSGGPRSVCKLMKRKFHVTLLEHNEGVSVSCPELPGCHSQGATDEEALENIRDAIQGYVELYGDPGLRCVVREMEVTTK